MPSIAFGFDAENKAAQRAAARQAASLVTEVSTESRLALRQLITRAIKDGIPPYDAGRLIEGMVGLNRRQMLAAYHLRTKLIDSGLAIDKVEKKIARYQAKLLKQRGRMIARTEIMNSLANGTEESWMQAQQQGKIGANAKKEWIITPLDACNICRSIQEPVPLQMPFMSIAGPIQNPTAHPNCRCAIVVVPGLPGAAPAVAMPGAPAPRVAAPPKPRKPRRRAPRRPAPRRVTSGAPPPEPKPLRDLKFVGGDADDALMKGIVTSQDEIAAGTSSETYLVEGKNFKGVFKPNRGEGWGLRIGITNKKFTLSEREVFSQVVDRRLGTNMVPTTRMRDVPGQGKGSIQRFVDDSTDAAKTNWKVGGSASEANFDDTMSQFILDLAIGNTDRHTGNFMIRNTGGRITSIDNALTFPAQRRLDFWGAKTFKRGVGVDRLGLEAFRQETYKFLLTRDAKGILGMQRERLLANIDATDWEALARTTNMNGLERKAFTERMKWLRERIDKNDLFDVLENKTFSDSFGFNRAEDIPGFTEIK